MFKKKVEIPLIRVPRDVCYWSDGLISKIDSLAKIIEAKETSWYSRRKAANVAKVTMKEMSLLLQANSGTSFSMLRRRSAEELTVYQADVLVDYHRLEMAVSRYF